MKRIFLLITIGCLSIISYSQQLAQVTLTNGGTADKITFKTEDAIFIHLTREGTVINWGVESLAGKYYNDPERMDQYMGRTEFYSATDPEDSRGKIKYLGRTAFTYYTGYENALLKGKVKSIGNIYLDYFDAYNDEMVRGKIRNAGTVSFSYYSSFDNEAFRGKFKNIGASAISYYASYDDAAYRGKIKSIGNQQFSYYSSFDRQEYRGAMKGNYQTQYLINGIKYLLR
jgi:hypothetical protein